MSYHQPPLEVSQVVQVHRYRRAEIQANPHRLFIFGDNMARAGFGGQAKEARGEPNAVGIPTKWSPAMTPDSFFTDEDFDEVKPVIDAAFERISQHMDGGGTVVWPTDGVGTGLAQLAERAPRIFEYIETRRQAMSARAVVLTQQSSPRS